MRFFRHVTILHGCAVGGGSITYAATLLRPPNKVWEMGSWAGLADWKAEMPRHYRTASQMLGVTANNILGPADELLQKTADSLGVGHTFYHTTVGILQPPAGQAGGETVPDPFFGGEGPTRTTCTACGGCMMGCREGAKNTLDLNYLYLAEKRGARVYPETKVVDVKPLKREHERRRGIRGAYRKLHRVAAPAGQTLHLPGRCLLGLRARHHGTSFQSQGSRLIAGHKLRSSASACAPIPNR